MKRFVFTFASLLSLLVFLTSAGLLVRGRWFGLRIDYPHFVNSTVWRFQAESDFVGLTTSETLRRASPGGMLPGNTSPPIQFGGIVWKRYETRDVYFTVSNNTWSGFIFYHHCWQFLLPLWWPLGLSAVLPILCLVARWPRRVSKGFDVIRGPIESGRASPSVPR